MKYTPEKVIQIVKLISDGSPANYAAVASDIDESTYYDWLKKYPEFQAAIKKAEAVRIGSLVSQIKNDVSWQSKAWLLERLSRSDFYLPGIAQQEILDRITKLEELITIKAADEHQPTVN